MSALGLGFFRLLGWRHKTIFPSDLRTVGSFNKDPWRPIRSRLPSPHSLPARQEYASEYERGAVAAIGRLQGCHSCGTRIPEAWVADHIPPNGLVVKQSRWYHVLVGVDSRVPQRFYPHCAKCASKQSPAVKKDFPRHVYNYSRLRSSDLTGLCVFSTTMIFPTFAM